MKLALAGLVVVMSVICCSSSGGIPQPTPEETIQIVQYMVLHTDFLLYIIALCGLLIAIGWAIITVLRKVGEW